MSTVIDWNLQNKSFLHQSINKIRLLNDVTVVTLKMKHQYCLQLYYLWENFHENFICEI